MKKVCVMSPSRKRAGKQRLDAANLPHRAEHEDAVAGPNIVRNEIPRLLENSESLLKESGHGG